MQLLLFGVCSDGALSRHELQWSVAGILEVRVGVLQSGVYSPSQRRHEGENNSY